jgi:hypothetical protein
VRNAGTGLIGYAWEEGGSSRRFRRGEESIENAVERLADLAFVDMLYIRCDWRHVQVREGRLDLHPVWDHVLAKAADTGLRVAFRIQASNPSSGDGQPALPAFLTEQVPMIPIGSLSSSGAMRPCEEPDYRHPRFRAAFAELTGLLADRFDADPLIEFVDLMMYGFWGEGHTGPLGTPFSSPAVAEEVMLDLTQLQLEAWRSTPLVVNLQPDISEVGNGAVQELALAAGCWVRSDSIRVEEPVQISQLVDRPLTAAAIIEDGTYRDHDASIFEHFEDGALGFNPLDSMMLHALDADANYWGLWTEAENLQRYFDVFPDALAQVNARLGYRLRPSWVWQRQRDDVDEIIVALSNDGVAAVPGSIRLTLFDRRGQVVDAGWLAAGHPAGDGLTQALIRVPRSLLGEEVGLAADIEVRPGVVHNVAWACSEPTDAEGRLWFRLRLRDEQGWRYRV